MMGWNLRSAVSATFLFVALAAPAAGQGTLEQALSLIAADKRPEAERVLLEVVKREPANHAAMYRLGRTILEIDDGRAKESAKWLEKAVKLQPNVSDYQLWLGRAWGTEAQNANVVKQASMAGKIKGAFERAVKLDPTSVEAHISMIDFYRAAPGVMGGSKEKAKEEAELVKRLSAWHGGQILAGIYAEDSNWAAAERELVAVEKAYPDSSAVRIQLIALYQNSAQWQRAFDAIDALLKAEPNNYSAVFQLGRAAALSGQHLERGEQALKRYLQHTPASNQPAHWAAHFRLGNIYEKMNRKDLARASYQATLKTAPDHEEAKKALQKLGK